MSKDDQGYAQFFISRMAHDRAGPALRLVVETLVAQSMQMLPDADDDFAIPMPTARADCAFVMQAIQESPDQWHLYIRFGKQEGDNIIVSQAPENESYAPVFLHFSQQTGPKPRPN